MKTFKRIAAVTLILALILGGIFGYKAWQFSQMAEQMSVPPPPTLVETVEVKQENWTPNLQSIGSVRAVNGVEIANELAGVVEEILFESGDAVSQGDLLVRLNVATNEAALKTRKAEASQARQRFNRAAELIKSKSVSQSDYDDAKAGLEAAEARVIEAEAELNKKLIRAPFAGHLGLRMVDSGEFLAVGTPIVELNQLDPIYVDFSVPEKQVANIQIGNTVTAKVSSFENRAFVGKVTAINSSVERENRTLRVRATFSNPKHELKPGMFAKVTTELSGNRDVLVVPRTAISFNSYGDFVFKIVEKNGQQVTTRQTISSGQIKNGEVEVTSGLQAGDTIVAAGLLRLRDGQPVAIQTSEATAQRNSQPSAASTEAGR